MKFVPGSVVLIWLAFATVNCAGPLLVGTATPAPATPISSPPMPASPGPAPSPTEASAPTLVVPSPARRLSEDEFFNRQNPVPELAWSTDGKMLAAAALSGLYVFDTQTGLIAYTLEEGEFLYPLAMDRQGQHLLAGNQVWDLGSGQLLYQLPLTNLSAAAFSPDGKRLAVSDGSSATLWDASAGKLQEQLGLGFGDAQQGLAYSPDGSLLYAISSDLGVKRMDLVSGEFMQLFSLPDGTCCSIFSPDTKFLVVGRPNYGAGSKQLWDVEHGEMIKDLGPCDSDVHLSAVSPDSRYFAIGPCGPDTQLWSASGQRLIQSIPSRLPTDPYPEWRSAVFGPDGTRLALGNDIGQVLIWDVDGHRLIGTLTVPQAPAVTD